jgi:hypothetical protein
LVAVALALHAVDAYSGRAARVVGSARRFACE